jgi:hypothetical protein
MRKALELVRQLFGAFALSFLGRVIEAIATESHGGTIWIVGEDRPVNGIQIGYPVVLDPRPLPERFEQRLSLLKSIGHLAAVDGAVLLNSNLQVLGFGAFVNIPKQQPEVAYLSPEGFATIEPRHLGGGRHRSAVQFCLDYAPAAAVVVSEDGRISLMVAGADRYVMCTPISILGFSDHIVPAQ